MSNRIDSHQHFWQLARNDYGWLTEEFGPIYRDFSPEDLRPLLAGSGVAKTLVVQAAPTVAETDYLLALAEQTDFIAGVVGWVDMDATDACDTLSRLARHPQLKGIRPMIQDLDDPAWMLKPELDKIYRRLIDAPLCFDALVKPVHLPHLLTLLKRYPKLKVVIDHGGKPDIAHNGFDTWAPHISAIAEQSSACCKLSGLLTEAAPGAGYTELKPYLEHLLESFGSERLLWGSDWPVLNLAGDYRRWLTIAEQFISHLGDREQAKIMGENATGLYGLNKENTPATDKRFLLLHPGDNIFVCCGKLEANESVQLEGEYFTLPAAIEIGHKLARNHINSGEKIIKYGVSIGSAKSDIPSASHVHLHNIKSDYIPSHIRGGIINESADSQEKSP